MFEMLSNAQNLRLEEQRGVHVSPGEMPSFLCDEIDKDTEFFTEDNRLAFTFPDPVYSVDAENAETIDLDQTLTNLDSPVLSSAFHALSPSHENMRCAETPSSESWNVHSLPSFQTPSQDKWKTLTDRRLSGATATPRKMSPVVVDSCNNTVTSTPLAAEVAPSSRCHTLDDLATPDASRLAGNISLHFPAESHAFRPLHTSNLSKAPVTCSAPMASPDHVFPESNKLKTNNDLLPNKISPKNRSSSSSSNVSTGSNHSQNSPNVVLTSPPSGVKSVQRLSETMLVHKINQAMREQRAGPDSSYHEDLAQRALLSPRFDHVTPQGRGSLTSQHSPSRDDSVVHHTVVSPLADHHQPLGATRHFPQNSPTLNVQPTSLIDKSAVLHTTFVMAGPTQTLLQSPPACTSVTSSPELRPPYRSPPAYTSVVKLAEETVTFV